MLINILREISTMFEEHGLNDGHAHAEKERRLSKKNVFASKSGCDDKDLMHSVAHVLADDGCTEDYCLSDAGAEEFDSSVKHMPSASHAAESVKKLSTFPVRCAKLKGSRKKPVGNDRMAHTKNAALT